MSIHLHLDTFGGLPVEYYQYQPLRRGIAFRLTMDDEEDDVLELMEHLLRDDKLDLVEGLVIGNWAGPFENDGNYVIDLLVRNARRLPNLRALFLGDVTWEESELSWIIQGDITRLFRFFPRLRALGTRGGRDLGLSPVRHEQLQQLLMQSAGLPAAVLESLARSELPALVSLELWLGTPDFGGIENAELLDPLLGNPSFGQLRHLGLRDAEISDDVARRLMGQPILKQLRTLDLSMGNLSDEGAEHLLQAELGHLERLDLHHHYLSEAMVERLKVAFPRVQIDASVRKITDDGYRYIEASE